MMNEDKKTFIVSIIQVLSAVKEVYSFDEEDVTQILYSICLEAVSMFPEPERVYENLLLDMQSLGGERTMQSIRELDDILEIEET